MEKLQNVENLLFTLVRDVKAPNRANVGDAGIDFYIPQLTEEDILSVGEKEPEDLGINRKMRGCGNIKFKGVGTKEVCVVLKPGARILLPSGVKVLISPIDSMLMAANKSGVSTKEGLTYTAEIIDSPYTGEMHIGIQNASNEDVWIPLKEGKKIMQFIHVPIIPSIPLEISNEAYEELSNSWGTRGSNGFGSTDKI